MYEKKREVAYAWFIKVDQICDMFIEAEVLHCKKKKICSFYKMILAAVVARISL